MGFTDKNVLKDKAIVSIYRAGSSIEQVRMRRSLDVDVLVKLFCIVFLFLL
jgi:hypothetical protein